MQLELKWNNLNAVPVTVNIYRGNTPVNRDALGTPVATLSSGETSWVDTNVTRGARYYYVFETISANDRTVSKNHEAYALPYSGPGPKQLAYGNYELGYFGTVLASDFFTADQVSGKVGLTTGTLNTNPNPIWHKFARKGRVLFIPETHLRTGISWKQFYDLGLVYGRDDNGPGIYTGAGVNQKRIIQLGLDSFLVRLPTGGPARSDGGFVVPTDATLPSLATLGSEWDDLIYPLMSWVPSTQKTINWSNRTRTDFHSLYNTPCQELIVGDTGNHLLRGTHAFSDERALTFHGSYAITTSSGTMAWRPVLEYIPSVALNLSI
jgi:hypothetical protein